MIRGKLRKSLDSTTLLTADTEALLNKITKAPQISVGFLSRISKGTGSNLYRGELAIDSGLWKFSSTTNLSFDFMNSQVSTKPNRNVGRVVQEFDIPLLPKKTVLSYSPLTFGLSGEGDWGSNGPPTYKAQGKIKLTVFNGFDIPMSVTYANRTATVARADLKAVIGIAVDFSKVSQVFHVKPTVFPRWPLKATAFAVKIQPSGAGAVKQ